MRVVIFAALAVCAMAVCAPSASAQEACPSDWRAAGQADASSTGASRLADRSAACAGADADAYNAGFDEGLRSFCSVQNGFRLGRGGGEVRAECDADLADGFVQAFNDGARLHASEEVLAQARLSLAELQRRRRDVERQLRAHERDPGEMPQEARAAHLASLDGLRQQRVALNAGLRSVQESLPGMEQQLASVRAEIGARYGALD
jgi:hypothetical protein